MQVRRRINRQLLEVLLLLLLAHRLTPATASGVQGTLNTILFHRRRLRMIIGARFGACFFATGAPLRAFRS